MSIDSIAFASGLTSYNQTCDSKSYNRKRRSKIKTLSISELGKDVKNNELHDNNDVQLMQLIKQLTANPKIHQLSNKLITHSITKLFNLTALTNRITKLKVDHQHVCTNIYIQNDHSDLFDRQSNRKRTSRFISKLLCQLFIFLIFISSNKIYAKDDGALSNQQQNAPFFTNNLPSKIAFYNTTGTVINCPVSGSNQKSTILWLTVGNSHSNVLNSKTNYRYTENAFSYQHWSNDQLNSNYRHYQTTNLPTQNFNLIENVLTSNPDFSPVIDLHNVVYTRNDGALVFPPFYANDLQPNVHNRKYRCLAINEQGAILSNEIQVKARKYFFFFFF